jgi:hypothetical protein
MLSISSTVCTLRESFSLTVGALSLTGGNSARASASPTIDQNSWLEDITPVVPDVERSTCKQAEWYTPKAHQSRTLERFQLSGEVSLPTFADLLR